MQPTNHPAIDQPPTVLKVRQEELRQRLRIVQARLGTSEEQPTDLAAVQQMAHRLNNLYMTEGFRSQVSRAPEGSEIRAWNPDQPSDPSVEGPAG